ncbi:hypothetical protein A7E78_00925 [Syntrophotalea acetylenivorans]|uniref:Uncharacterized protein n=1 Tax=Syntrophotalea acetylenivorans TaxID=1842532 RepID=A0A1L3GKU7_9BACT|nr:hypothetical protein [Syntrophotalea acetylenivorans]APG26549.1 hypothetical protein A7E78_00925 [Syntrophotalea acetylenivorans]
MLNAIIVVGMCFFASEVVYLEATTAFQYTSSENTLIENCQNLLLLLMISLSAWSVRHQKSFRVFFAVLSILALVMLIREQNNWFRDEWFRGAWQLVVAMVLIPSGLWLFRHRRPFWAQLQEIRLYSASIIASVGFVILMTFARILGKKEIWIGIMGEYYMRSVKMIVEESLELLGYSLMFAGLLSLILAINRTQQVEAARD